MKAKERRACLFELLFILKSSLLPSHSSAPCCPSWSCPRRLVLSTPPWTSASNRVAVVYVPVTRVIWPADSLHSKSPRSFSCSLNLGNECRNAPTAKTSQYVRTCSAVRKPSGEDSCFYPSLNIFQHTAPLIRRLCGTGIRT